MVVGFVETHGRALTGAQLRDLEVVSAQGHRVPGPEVRGDGPRRGARPRPEVALVDELAHTNVPGSRNAKRWQDIDELLAAGIDVISTVNIQHLESLNDVVERITGVVQRETVPDAVVRAADQIELVDMTPEALRRRMAHGNIYAAEKVDAALSHYFRVGNLGALRELALLWVADRVDESLEEYRERHGITEPVGDPGTGRRGPDRCARRGPPHSTRAPAWRHGPTPSSSACTSETPTASPAWTADSSNVIAVCSTSWGAASRRSPGPSLRRRSSASPEPRTPPSSCSGRRSARGGPS